MVTHKISGEKESKTLFAGVSTCNPSWKLTPIFVYNFLTRRVFRKKCFFLLNSLQPLSRLHRCKRPSKLSTQCEGTVTPIGEVTNFREILKKNKIFNECIFSTVTNSLVYKFCVDRNRFLQAIKNKRKMNIFFSF